MIHVRYDIGFWAISASSDMGFPGRKRMVGSEKRTKNHRRTNEHLSKNYRIPNEELSKNG